MATKRGRPILEDDRDAATELRRMRTRERMRQLRQRQRDANNNTSARSAEQLAQGEQIVNFTTSVEEDAAATLLQLGLRVQDLTLPQNAAEAELQRDATDANEHHAIYSETERAKGSGGDGQTRVRAGFFKQFARRPPQRQEQDGSRPSQAPLARYFPSLPARSGMQDMTTRRVSSPTCDALLQTPVAGPSTIEAEPYNDEPSAEGPAVTDQQEYPPNQTGQESSIQPDEEVRNRGFGSEDLLGLEQLPGPEDNRSDSNSCISFVPEHASLHIEEGDNAETTAHDFVVEKLYDELVQGFHGCTEEDHHEDRRRHIVDAGENHHGLEEIFNDNSFPSVLGLQEMITPERLARERMPTPEQWRSVFCGIPTHGRQRYPNNVCLHKEETRAVDADIAFDIDSFLGFATSLAFARKGLWSQIAPQTKQNINSDVHISDRMYAPNEDPGRPDHSRLAMLQRIPHFMLGRIEGAHDITIFVLFPHIPVLGDKFKSLSEAQLSRWADQIYLPALHKFYRAHYTQHVPASFRTASGDSKAHSVETRQVQGQSYNSKRAIGYHLQPEYLDDVWGEILTTIANVPGLADFRDPQIFFSSKGTKLQFKTSDVRPQLGDAMDYFQSFLEDCLDLDFVETDRLYVDVGKEICPRTSLIGDQERHLDDEPQVYAWKRCCLEKYIKWMYDDQAPKKGEGQRYYTQNMLHDTGSLTSVTPKKSKHREGGLIYSQFYNSVKEIYDANKCFPFANDAMEELALDPHIRNATRNILGGGRRDAKTVEVGYLASKQRTHHALRDARRKSFGIREEHRVTWAVFQGLKDRLNLEDTHYSAALLTECPAYAWAIKTEVFIDFLWRSVDKFATGFEIVKARSRKDFTTWEQTKMMAMFLRCLRYVCGGRLLEQEGALWHSKREKMVGEPPRLRLWYGLGFKNTLAVYKYCWLEPRIDWNVIQFKSDVTDDVLFGNKTLQGQYLRRGKQARGFFDISRQLELALDWIGTYSNNGRLCDRFATWMVHICLVQLRLDVTSAVKAEVKAEWREEALKGERAWSYEYLDEIMSEGCYLMSGNKTEFKQVSDLGHFLFDYDDGLVREHWEDRPFRVLYRRARTGIKIRNKEYSPVFEGRFWEWLYKYHWVLPYPCGNALLQTTKSGKRMWYSIWQSTGKGEESGKWKWARKGWQAGRPRDFPEWTRWSKENWQEWIKRGV
jgi:hypothetical protein